MPLTGPQIASGGAAAADRRLLGEIKTELARPYDDSDPVNLALAGDAWRSAVRAYNRFCWPWERLTVDITVVAGTATYSLPAAFKAPMGAYMLSGSRESQRLGWLPYDSLIAEYALNQDGSPRLYTQYNEFETGTVQLWPRPTSSGTARIFYFRNTPADKDDNTAVEAPDYAVEAMMDWARYLMVTYKLAGEGGRVQAARADALQSRAELVQMVNARHDSVGEN